ncbi:MAG: tetratricopeptide repeat protein, partial [Deltaproteobacteria bacterium]
ALAAGASEATRLDLVIALARAGELDAARREVDAALRANPGSERARRLAELLD